MFGVIKYVYIYIYNANAVVNFGMEICVYNMCCVCMHVYTLCLCTFVHSFLTLLYRYISTTQAIENWILAVTPCIFHY